MSITDTTVELGPGDLLIMVTDGVLEARRDDEQFGEAGLQALLQATQGADVDTTVHAVAKTVMAYQDGPPADDTAVLAIAPNT